MKTRARRVAVVCFSAGVGACVLFCDGLVVRVGAATLTNRDLVEHSVRVLTRNEASGGAGAPVEADPIGPGVDRKSKFSVLPGGQVENICAKGCVLRLDGSKDHDYRIEGGELLSIEDGALYFDGEIEKGAVGSP